MGFHQALKTKFIEGNAGFMSLVAIALIVGLAFCIERIIYLSLSEINAKTKVKTFKLKFKDCAGIPNKKAQIKLTKRATCEGTANDGAGFANGSTAADKASAVAVEVWSTETPATGSATQFSCVTPASQEVTISNAANAVVYYPMSARLVVEKNKTVSNVTAGKFSAPATFTVTYN